MDCHHESPTRDHMDIVKVVTPRYDDESSTDNRDKICAYFKLIFPNFQLFVQNTSVTIGRRSVRSDGPSTSEIPQCDVDLGPLKSVSRFHAKIEYEDNEERFVLVVLGRNGAWVDGIWSGSGSRVPLGSRSLIQIATRVFDFVLPPPPAPEDSPSPSSPSTTRHHSPSIDITSVSPDSSVHSPITKDSELPPIDITEKPSLQPLARSKPPLKSSSKKRKKPGDARPPPPAVMPPRPQFTYAQLCYKAICAMEGKATLQDICCWVSDNFDWYRYNEGSGWESSIRHNLSSNRAFKKMERCAGERGKGFFWSVDEQFEHLVKDHEGKGQGEGARNKAKNSKLLEPPLKRSVKGDPTSPLPPPLPSSIPLSLDTNIAPTDKPTYPTSTHTSAPVQFNAQNVQQQHPSTASTSSVTSGPVKFEHMNSNFQGQAQLPQVQAAGGIKAEVPEQPNSQPTQSSPSAPSTSSSVAAPASTFPPISSDIVIPIVIGSVPSTVQSSSPITNDNATSSLDLTSPPIALHQDTIVLNPMIFSSLTSAQLKELELLGAKKAIEILQTYIVRFLKEKRKSEAKGKKKKSKKKDGQGGGGGGSNAGSTATTAVNDKEIPSSRSAEVDEDKMGVGDQQREVVGVSVKSESNQEGTDKKSNENLTVSVPKTEAQDTTITTTTTLDSSLTTGTGRAGVPPRISSPPLTSVSLSLSLPLSSMSSLQDNQCMEEIDIMGDEDDMEHVSKRRRLDVGPEQIQV